MSEGGKLHETTEETAEAVRFYDNMRKWATHTPDASEFRGKRVLVTGGTKGAVGSFARAWTTDLKNRRSRVNAVVQAPLRRLA
jgi:hypothetical protein